MSDPEVPPSESGSDDGSGATDDAVTDEGDGTLLLRVEDLEVHYPITEGLLRREVGRVRAVDGVSFQVGHGETLGLVGESGSGKTSTAHAILRLEEPTGGHVAFDGDRVGELSGAALRAFRRRVQLVVQDPNEAFNPRMRVGEAVAEPLVLHGMDDADRRRRLVESTLDRVGLAAADADRYPHEFSDGEKQRIAVARALVPNPDLIVADEPTSALDERVKADVLALLADVRREFDVSILFVSHDLDVVRRFCDRVAVMYHGELVERGPTDDVFESPAHPFTRVLRGSIPSLEPGAGAFPDTLTDATPDPGDPPSGCRFHPRCPEVIPPEDLDVPWDVWTSIAAFRFAVETDAVPDPVSPRGGSGPVDEATVRDAFDLPERIADATARRAVEDAVDAVAGGDLETAGEVLADALPTVCAQRVPSDAEVSGRRVQCHRYDESVDAEPRPLDGHDHGDT